MIFSKRIPVLLLLPALFLATETRSFADENAPMGHPPAASNPHIDQAGVHAEYVNGNFEAVVEKIESFRKANSAHSRDDSIFIARHLAVVLAADPKSVEAGKYWMHRLLSLAPNAELEGMYASEAIERMFAGVKKELKTRNGRPSHRKWLWIGAGGSAVAAAIAIWVAFSPGEESPEPTVVPVKL